MNCFSCCMSGDRGSKRSSFKKSIKEFRDTKDLTSFANISSKSDDSRRRYIAEEIANHGKGNISAQIFSFSEVTAATDHFNPDNLVGEGGFRRVYKSHLERTKQDVAVSNLTGMGSKEIGNSLWRC